MPQARVAMHRGTPTLFLDQTPAFPGYFWSSGPAAGGFEHAPAARGYAQAGIHLHTFDVGTGGVEPEWCGPRPGAAGDWDFSSLRARFGRVLDLDPEACFHLRVHLRMPIWWRALHPGECALSSLGEGGPYLGQSYASQVWRDQAEGFLRAYAGAVREAGLEERVLAYQVGAGDTGEWVCGDISMDAVCGDYSPPMRRHFQGWLRDQYRGDEALLRSAWKDPQAGFDTAQVPAAAAQLHTTHHSFRDPSREQPVIDYYRCLAQLCGERVIGFCRAVKEATGGRALAGAFYGYLMELAWNKCFFGVGEESGYSTYQRSGHLGLRRVLRSEGVDFLVSPYSYGLRGVGGDGSAMQPAESLRHHGVLCIVEDDTRVHLAEGTEEYGRVHTLEDSVAVLQRNFAQALCRGQGVWWYPEIDPSRAPSLQPLLKRFAELGAFGLHLDRRPSAEIAVILDDESFFYQSPRNDLDLPLIFHQRLWGLPRLGAPFDTYLLEDLCEGNLPEYKLYIFLNAFRLDRARRHALAGVLRRQGQVALWLYAPGYLADDLSLGHMEELTGFRFGKGEHPWGPMMQLTQFDHPITQGLPQDLSWGTHSPLGPLFHLEDREAQILGQVVYSQGRCKPGLGVKAFSEWTSVYCAAPNLPAPLLRGLARFAGVHLYSEAGDVLCAGPQLLGVHTLSGGARRFCLPRPVEVVCELFSGAEVAHNADHFEVELAPRSTALYYTGDQGALAMLEAREN